VTERERLALRTEQDREDLAAALRELRGALGAEIDLRRLIREWPLQWLIAAFVVGLAASVRGRAG
jgi:hypothetical protein